MSVSFNIMVILILGATEDSGTPETPCEENDIHILTLPQDEKIQAFVQDSLDAHEEFLMSQSTRKSQEHQSNGGHLESEDPGQSLGRKLLEDDDPDKSLVKQPVSKEKEEVGPENASQKHGSDAGETLETEKVEDTKQPNQSYEYQLMENETVHQQLERKQLHLVRSRPHEEDKTVPMRGPGTLITDMEDAEQLETIYLPLHHTLCTDDLPDLEEVDTEDLTAMCSSQQAFKPIIQVISGGSDEDEPTWNQSEDIPTCQKHQDSLFFVHSCPKSSAVSNKSSLMYPEDELSISEPARESKSIQSSSPARCLIEQLD